MSLPKETAKMKALQTWLGREPATRKYEVAPITLQFEVTHGVYPVNGGGSVCYCTDERRAEMIARAVELYLSTDEGWAHMQWLSERPSGWTRSGATAPDSKLPATADRKAH